MFINKQVKVFLNGYLESLSRDRISHLLGTWFYDQEVEYVQSRKLVVEVVVVVLSRVCTVTYEVPCHTFEMSMHNIIS